MIVTGYTVHSCGDRVLVTDKTPVLKGICVGQPNGTMMRSSHTVLLHTLQLSLAAQHTHILQDMKDRCIMSVGQLCDDRFAVKFYATHDHRWELPVLHYHSIRSN